MNLGLRQGHRHAENASALIRADADSREYGDVAHDPAMAHLFIPCVEDEVLDLAKRPITPSRQFFVEQFGRAADLR